MWTIALEEVFLTILAFAAGAIFSSITKSPGHLCRLLADRDEPKRIVGCLGEIPALEPFVVGVVRCHGLMLPIPSHCSRRASRSRLIEADSDWAADAAARASRIRRPFSSRTKPPRPRPGAAHSRTPP